VCYKADFANAWIAAGGLITPAVASRILGVSRSVITHRKDIEKYRVGADVFVSFTEIMGRTDIQPRTKLRKPGAA
jgi:hypothetical protein